MENRRQTKIFYALTYLILLIFFIALGMFPGFVFWFLVFLLVASPAYFIIKKERERACPFCGGKWYSADGYEYFCYNCQRYWG